MNKFIVKVCVFVSAILDALSAGWNQIVFAISPIFMLIIFLVKQSEQVIYTFLAIGIALPFGLFYILMEIFTMLQVIRCKKIKKTIPRYSKSEIYRWNRP